VAEHCTDDSFTGTYQQARRSIDIVCPSWERLLPYRYDYNGNKRKRRLKKNLWEFKNHKRIVNNKDTDQWMGELLYKAIRLQFAPPPNVQKDISWTHTSLENFLESCWKRKKILGTSMVSQREVRLFINYYKNPLFGYRFNKRFVQHFHTLDYFMRIGWRRIRFFE